MGGLRLASLLTFFTHYFYHQLLQYVPVELSMNVP